MLDSYSFLPPTLKMLRGHIALGLSVPAYVRPSLHPFKKNKVRVLKLHKWIPHQKIADPYFFV